MKTKVHSLLIISFIILHSAGIVSARAQAGVVFTSLHSFGVVQNGNYPEAGLVQGSDGYFYGTTEYGGTNGGFGTVFKFSTNGVLTSLYAFTGGADGAWPFAGLVQGSDGNFYGTTYGGGTGKAGTVFKFSTNGVLTSLYAFTGGADGAWPFAGLVQGSDGSFYGTTGYGGAYGSLSSGFGTVFKISANGALSTLYSFTGTNDGAVPEAGLVQVTDGNLYGTANRGAMNNSGTIFKISTNGLFKISYVFTGGTDGRLPAGLVLGGDGYLYGTTSDGGTNSAGTVFKFGTNGTLTTLYSFGSRKNTNNVPLDGSTPDAALVQGKDGYFYGTTYSGGTNEFGTVFKISTNGALTTLYSFTGGNDGVFPQAALVQGTDGSFCGTTFYGGASDFGTIYQISTSGAYTSLYSFTAVIDDGANPFAGLVQGSDGNFYGTTAFGGANQDGQGYGTVFKIGANGTYVSLYSFGGYPDSDGANPEAGLVQGSDGWFYGTTAGINSGGVATVFRISTNAVLTSLCSFGGYPSAALVQGADGSFYGTTPVGGMYNLGTVFKFSTNGVLTNLYSFVGGLYGIQEFGASPEAPLLQGSDGYFYGTTQGGGAYTNQYGGRNGTLFNISANGAFSTMYSFIGTNDGRIPNGLVQGSDGNFYGTTQNGGTNNAGTVFKFSHQSGLTTLYSFTGGADGGNPQAGLVQGSDGNFYGTTSGGGTYGYGSVFEVNTNGALASLYSFTGLSNGAGPAARLVQGRDGSFYGTTSTGGQGNAGTVFRLTIVPPQLTIISSGPDVILTWPTNTAAYTLEFATNLVLPAVWQTNSTSPVIISGQNVVVVPISGTQRFFRLGQ